jgi:ankyrin repeat protein
MGESDSCILLKGESVSSPYMVGAQFERIQTMNSDFIDAVKNHDYRYLHACIISGRTPNVVGSDGKSALLVATEAHDPSMVQWLLEHGANVDFYAPDDKIIDQTAFLSAGANGYTDILEILIPYEPDVSIRNGYGGNALIPAAEKGHVDTVRLLLEKTKVDVNFVNRLGWTALLEAVIYGRDNNAYHEVVRLLLHHGAAPRLSDKDGVTPLEHAQRRNLTMILPLLLDEG